MVATPEDRATITEVLSSILHDNYQLFIATQGVNCHVAGHGFLSIQTYKPAL